MERWKTCAGFPDYEISDKGRVRRATDSAHGPKKGHILKPWVQPNGYLVVSLWRNGKGFNRYIHRMVAITFHGHPPAGHEVAHIDGNPANNSAINLRWATKSENHIDKRRHGTMLRGERHHSAKLTANKVTELRRAYAEGKSIDRLANETGVHRMTIYRAVKRLSWRHVT